MKASFYDVKLRKSVNVEVVGKKKTETGRCMIYGKTADGRMLPKFTSEADYKGKFGAVPACKACKKK